MLHAQGCVLAFVVSLGVLLSLTWPASAAPPARAAPPAASDMALVGPERLELFDPPEGAETSVMVPAFLLDKRPVTNADYLAFAKTHPDWQRGRVPPLSADERYLGSWEGPTTLGARADPETPVVGVSWFAAKAYCEARGRRLPTENEWEVAAAAGETSPHGVDDPAWTQRVLTEYLRSTPDKLRKVGMGAPNYWGLFDLHGLVWEWIYDFNAHPPAGDARAGSRFTCGGAPRRAEDRADYPRLARFAFRSALRPSYTATSLGFRCAADVERSTP